MPTAREDAEARFPTDIANHRMTVIRDDGLYRHLRFSRPDTNCYSFHILTWPGYLAYVGDMGDYVFQRTEDMFEFFRHDRINPGYWAEKVQAACKSGVREYSEDRAREWVRQSVKESSASDEIKATADDIAFDEGADNVYRQLRDHEHSEELFFGLAEASFNEYTWNYIWCCLALVWAIKQYDAAKAVPRG
jgi:hypothetical protein